MVKRSERKSAPDLATGAIGDFTTDRRVLTLALMALVTGAGGTAAAWLLLKLIALATNLIWFQAFDTETRSLATLSPSAWMIAAPVLGGLAIGLMARFGSEKIRGHGIPEALEAILIGGSRMQPKVAVLKPISSAISIGSGGPFGAEGPIIMTGGAIGSLFAQCFSMSAAERKTLLVAGAAAGMTAIFGTPIAAILLGIELMLFEWKPRSFIPLVVSSAFAAALRPFVLGGGTLFPAIAHSTLGNALLPAALLVGLVAGLQSGLMTILLYKAEDLFERLPIHWMWWPAIGGAAVGLGGLLDPRALGVGYDVIGTLLSSGNAAFDAPVLLLLVKSAIWLVALASGTSGGVLAPLLILGGTAGWLEGHYLFGDPAFFALIGMAAMMGGTMRAPLTGIIFAVELTGNFEAILPLTIATAAAYTVTVLLMKRSILTEKLARRGHHITREYATDPLVLLRARDVMVRAVDTLPHAMPVTETVAFFRSDAAIHKAYPVVDDERRCIGMVTRADALAWGDDEDDTKRLAEICERRRLVYASADEPLGAIVARMVDEELSRMPVLDRDGRLAGLLARRDILHAQVRNSAAEREPAIFFRQAQASDPGQPVAADSN